MTWLLLTGAGLVAETVVIVALGRSVTARDGHDDAPQVRAGTTPRGSDRGFGLAVLDDQGAPVKRRNTVREAIS